MVKHLERESKEVGGETVPAIIDDGALLRLTEQGFEDLEIKRMHLKICVIIGTDNQQEQADPGKVPPRKKLFEFPVIAEDG